MTRIKMNITVSYHHANVLIPMLGIWIDLFSRTIIFPEQYIPSTNHFYLRSYESLYYLPPILISISFSDLYVHAAVGDGNDIDDQFGKMVEFLD